MKTHHIARNFDTVSVKVYTYTNLNQNVHRALINLRYAFQF